MIAIIDYGSGNIQSLKNTLDFIGVESSITNNPEIIKKAERIILPGVGSFGYMMEQLEKLDLIPAIKKSIDQGKPFLGICLGLQALFQESDESPGVKGLSIFKGRVKKFSKGKIPQIGWNNITPTNNNLFKKEFFYFVNSYYVVPNDKNIISTTSNYYQDFTSSIQSNNITATQFHPEKSGQAGIDLLKRWLAC
tara:strand:+ start:143 stop:724 length:582 start_codon:yes stop_codon:yes gene_type:complete